MLSAICDILIHAKKSTWQVEALQELWDTHAPYSYRWRPGEVSWDISGDGGKKIVFRHIQFQTCIIKPIWNLQRSPQSPVSYRQFISRHFEYYGVSHMMASDSTWEYKSCPLELQKGLTALN